MEIGADTQKISFLMLYEGEPFTVQEENIRRFEGL